MEKNCQNIAKRTKLRQSLETSFDECPNEVLSLILQPFQENEESLFVSLVCRRWYLLIKHRPISINQIISHYVAHGENPLSALKLVRQVLNDDTKFLVSSLFQLGPPNILEWAFPLLKDKPRTVIRGAAIRLVKGGHLNYLKALHNSKLLLRVYLLHLPAISEGHLNILKWLKKHNYWPIQSEFNDIRINTEKAARCAAKNGHKDALVWLYENYDVDAINAVLGAAEGGQIDILSSMYRYHHNVYDVSRAAAKGGQLELLKSRLRNGLNELTAMGAAEGGHLNILQFLEKNGVKCDNLCSSAVKGGQLELLKYLIENGPKCSVSIRDAIQSGNIEMLEFLLKHKYCEIKNKEDYYVSMQAVLHGHFNIVRWLVTNGFPCSEKCAEAVAYVGDLDTLKFLKENGVCLTEDFSHNASEAGHLHILQWLRENGAKLSNTALNNAEENEDWEMVAYIREWMGENNST